MFFAFVRKDVNIKRITFIICGQHHVLSFYQIIFIKQSKYVLWGVQEKYKG
jgi:hypothetical protein